VSRTHSARDQAQDEPGRSELPKHVRILLGPRVLTPNAEVYVFARGPAERVKVLAYAEDTVPELGMLWPVEWTTTYGKGRVYVSVYGHVWPGDVQPAGMRCAAVQTIIPRCCNGWLDGK
jgi:type 1 glutamine amidotransferase